MVFPLISELVVSQMSCFTHSLYYRNWCRNRSQNLTHLHIYTQRLQRHETKTGLRTNACTRTAIHSHFPRWTCWGFVNMAKTIRGISFLLFFFFDWLWLFCSRATAAKWHFKYGCATFGYVGCVSGKGKTECSDQCSITLFHLNLFSSLFLFIPIHFLPSAALIHFYLHPPLHPFPSLHLLPSSTPPPPSPVLVPVAWHYLENFKLDWIAQRSSSGISVSSSTTTLLWLAAWPTFLGPASALTSAQDRSYFSIRTGCVLESWFQITSPPFIQVCTSLTYDPHPLLFLSSYYPIFPIVLSAK